MNLPRKSIGTLGILTVSALLGRTSLAREHYVQMNLNLAVSLRQAVPVVLDWTRRAHSALPPAASNFANGPSSLSSMYPGSATSRFQATWASHINGCMTSE